MSVLLASPLVFGAPAASSVGWACGACRRAGDASMSVLLASPLVSVWREPPLLPAKGSWRGCRSSKRAGLFEETSGRPLRGSSGPPREKDEPPTGTGSFNSLTPFSGSPGSR